MRELLEPFVDAGARPQHVERVVRVWLAGGGVARESPERRLSFSKALRAALDELETRLERVAEVVSEHPGADGGERLLLRLADGKSVESVLLPRDGVCVSTQVGCAVGCTFCMTGVGGLERQLSSAEILAQVVQARRRRRLRRVVLMGMGEPSHNLPAVLEALTYLGHAGGFGHKELVFSTVGEPRVFERLRANAVKPALALSLHTTDRAKREALLPRAPKVEPRELLECALDYAARTGHPLQLQWTLLAGVNDGDDELERLVPWLRGRRAIVNFIPYNRVEAFAHASTSPERAPELVRTLRANGILAKLRLSVASDVDGACGQLRARLQPS